MRGANGESRVLNNTLETIHAAANAIASVENRVPQATVQKRRWGGWWSIYWCFGSYKQKKRIGPAVLVYETGASVGNVSAAENPTQTSTFTLPFVAPPSSPASFLPSDPPSVTQSPAGLVSLTSISASMYSPGPPSFFAIGPYAHETQLVSPPVFSAFPTEPSTAPFTPPPESVHLTTPSSPEVPFAHFLGTNLQYGDAGQRFPISQYEFQSYHLHPGSPVGQLISPSSGISGSGTSSPFLDGDFAAGLRFPEFQMGDSPKLLNLDKLSNREWGSFHGSGTLTPDGTTSTSCNGFLLDYQISEIVLHQRLDEENQTDQVVVSHGSSFGITDEKAARCGETETAKPPESMPGSLQNEAEREGEENTTKLAETYECPVGETYNERPEKAPADRKGESQHHKNRSITFGSAKEFNFDYVYGCAETETATLSEPVPESPLSETAREREENTTELVQGYVFRVGETYNERPEKPPEDREEKPQHHKNRSITLGSIKEFNFDYIHGSVETETATPSEAVPESPLNEATREREENTPELVETCKCRAGETYNEGAEKAPAVREGRPRHHKNQSSTLGSAKEFNFDSVDRDYVHDKPVDWWANEKVVGNDDGVPKNWSFFPMMQAGVS